MHNNYGGGRPRRPHLEDEPTDPGGGYDNDETGPTLEHGGYEGDEAETVIPGSRSGGRGSDVDEEATVIPESGDIDKTEAPWGHIQPTLGLLWVKEGNRRGTIYKLRDVVVIGRADDSQVVLDERGVSGRHAKLRLDDGQLFITDLDSSYGTYVNGKRIRERTPLDENDVIRIGETTFVVKLLEAKPRRPANRRKTSRKS